MHSSWAQALSQRLQKWKPVILEAVIPYMHTMLHARGTDQWFGNLLHVFTNWLRHSLQFMTIVPYLQLSVFLTCVTMQMECLSYEACVHALTLEQKLATRAWVKLSHLHVHILQIQYTQRLYSHAHRFRVIGSNVAFWMWWFKAAQGVAVCWTEFSQTTFTVCTTVYRPVNTW